MSTEAQVNSAFPDYLNYYLYSNSIGTFYQYTLSYANGEYSIDSWNYEIAQPTMTDLQVYTLSAVQTFTQAYQDRSALASASVPMVIDEARELGLASIGDISLGALVWCSTEGELHCWNGTQWKTVSLV
jgi:hypothetical protein